jgi:orotidine-5'-phosphate decarboxylase
MMAAAKASAPPRTKVVAVTVLTSLDRNDLLNIGVERSPGGQVKRLAGLARDAGLDGIVCSGAEVKAARTEWPEAFLVVPGVRPAGAESQDQKRVVTPAEALADGASVLVIGRPISAAPNPRRAIMDIASSLPQTPANARI